MDILIERNFVSFPFIIDFFFFYEIPTLHQYIKNIGDFFATSIYHDSNIFQLSFKIWVTIWNIGQMRKTQFFLSIRSPFFLMILLKALVLFGVFSLHPQCGNFFYWDRVLKSMTWYKRLRFIYKIIIYVSWFPFCYLICINGYLSLHIYITCIIHDLSTLGVA